ncbi:MAG: GTP-binding protein [Candidatus Edwardsbacteria bacterium]
MNFQNNINVCVCGHTQIGKSTIVGRLLVELGKISSSELKKYREKASLLGEEKHVYAMLVHTSKEEDEIKKTQYPSYARIDFSNKIITLIDTPGHQIYYKNMIFGIFQADCAILVVEAPKGPQEETFSVLRILKGFDIPIISVVITKMDEIQYDMEKFDKIKIETIKVLEQHNLASENIKFIPVSGLEGEGLVKRNILNMKDTLYTILKNLTIRILREDFPLRTTMRRSNIFKLKGIGTVGVCEIEYGTLRKKDELIFEPVSTILNKKITAKVRSIQLAKGVIASPAVPIEQAYPRNIVGVAIHNSELDLHELLSQCNNIAGLSSCPPSVTSFFEAEITVVHHPGVIPVGYKCILHPHADQVSAEIVSILKKSRVGTTEYLEDTGAISSGERAIVQIKSSRSVAIEESNVIPSLSKFIIRTSGIHDMIIGFGKCIKIL